jgi:hypothetical protein
MRNSPSSGVRLFGALIASFSLAAGLSAQPTDNPVASHYGVDAGYPAWTDNIRWDNVIDMSTYANGANHFERFENARDELYAQGGGVLYYPAGEYVFDLPDRGFGPGMGALNRGLMLKSGVVIRGADLVPGQDQAVIRASEDPTNPLFSNDVTYNLAPQTVFVFPRVARGTCPVTGDANAAGSIPSDWSLIGLYRPEGGTVADVHNVGVVNVQLDSGVITFGFHQEWAERRRDGWWRANQAKLDWPPFAPEEETFGGHTPTGQHYIDALIGKTNPGGNHLNPVSVGSGRLIMGVRMVNAATAADMLRPHASNSPVDSFAHFRFAGRIMAYGSNVFVANNVISKPTKNFVFRQLHNAGLRNMLFDHANHIGIDINKSGFGGNHNSETVIGPGVGMNAPNVIVRDNWVFNRGNKNFEIAGDGVVILNNHAEKYRIHRTIYAGYITNPQVFGMDPNSPDFNPMAAIDMGGVSFDGWSWQTSTSASDYMNRGFDIGGRNLWAHRNSLVNSGSIGNDGEGVMAQEHNRVGVYSWAFTDNMHGRANKGPGTIGENGWHGSWNMQQFGFLLLRNWSNGSVGFFGTNRTSSPETRFNWLLDASIVGGNTGPGGTTLGLGGTGGDHLGPNEPIDYNISDHSDPVSAPVDVTAVVQADGSVRIDWVDTADNELGFRVDRRVNGGNWLTVAYRPLSNLLPTIDDVQDPLEILRGTGESLVTNPTMVSELNPQMWIDFLAPTGSAESIEYRVVAININDDDSTGVSDVVMVNLGEAVAPQVPVGVALRIDSGDIKLNFVSVAGLRYQLQRSTNLAPDSWVNVGPEMVGDGTEMEMTHESGAPASGEQVFFRIQVLD